MFTTAWLKLERRELTLDTDFFAFINDGGGYSHGVIKLGKVGGGDVIELEEPLDKTAITK